MTKNIVITGVSTGIGRATLDLLHQKGYRIYGSVRTKEGAEELSSIYTSRFTPLRFDVQNHDEVVKAAAIVFENCDHITALINNAGIAVPGPLELLSDEEFDMQLDVNVKAVRRITNQFLPLLRTQKGSNKQPGRIINISSVSGLFNSPFNGAYCISKHALESMNDVYRRELQRYGIQVIAIEPGPIKTEIWKKNLNTMDRFKGSDYDEILKKADQMIENAERHALPVEKVSTLILKCLSIRKPKTRYIVHKNKFFFRLMAYYFPDQLTDWLVKKTLTSSNRHRPI